MVEFSPSYISLVDINSIYSVTITTDIISKPTLSFIRYEPNSEVTNFNACKINKDKYVKLENIPNSLKYKLTLKNNMDLGHELNECVLDYKAEVPGILISFHEDSKGNVGANERVLVPIFNELNHPLKNNTEVKGESTSLVSTNISCNPTTVYFRNKIACKYDLKNLSSYPILSSANVEVNHNSIPIADNRLIMPEQEFSVQFPIDSILYASGKHEVKSYSTFSTVSGEDTPLVVTDTTNFYYFPLVALIMIVGLISLIFVILIRRNKNKLTNFFKWIKRKVKIK